LHSKLRIPNIERRSIYIVVVISNIGDDIMNKKEFYKYIENRFGEDIGDLFYMIDKDDLKGAKEIVAYFRKKASQ